MKKEVKRVSSLLAILLLLFSTIAPYTLAAINLPENSTDSGTPLSVSPSLEGEGTWYFDGYTEIVNDMSNAVIGNAYRYRSTAGKTVTMINPGSIGDWVEQFGGDRHEVIAKYTSGSILTYKMTPPSPKVAFDRLAINDIITASEASYNYRNGKIYVTPPEGAPKITKFAIKEKPENACYEIGSTVNIDIEVQQYLPNSNKLKYVEVYEEDTGNGTASTLKKWTDVTTDSSGKVSLTIPYKISKKDTINFYIRAYDALNRFDKDTESLKQTVGSITPVGLKISVCGEFKNANKDGKIPYFDNKNWLDAPLLASGQPLFRVDDTSDQTVLGRYRYPTIFDGNFELSSLSKLNSSFTVDVPFKNTGGDRSFIKYGYQNQPYYHLITEGGTAARNIIEVEKVSADDLRNVYNGNPDYMLANLPQHEVQSQDWSEHYGNYYYIRQIAYHAGGLADNATASNEYNNINPTWLRFMRTDWPDIITFKTKETTYALNKPITFEFDGYEYVSEDRNKVDTRITITKKGSDLKKIFTNVKSDKSKKNPAKKNQGEAGYYQGTTSETFVPTEEGTYTAELYVEDTVKRYTSKKITFVVGKPDEEDPSGPPTTSGECKIVIDVNESGDMTSNPDDMLADPIGSITEDDETDSSIFDVLTYGIPSDEMLKLQGETERYLSDFKWQQYSGTVTYTIHVDKTYNLNWKERVSQSCSDGKGGSYDCSYDVPMFDTEMLETDIDEVHEISYWQIGHLVIFKFNDLVFKNYAIPNGEVQINNTRHDIIVEALHSSKVEDHVIPKDCENITLPGESLDGGYSRPVPDAGAFQAEAQAAVDAGFDGRIPDVKNDRVHITTTSQDRYGAETLREEVLYMDDKVTPSHGPDPKAIPKADRVELELRNQHIDPLKVNKWQTRSEITANYVPIININKDAEPLVSFTNTSDDPSKINKVTVHTPVVMYGAATDDKKHDQRTNPPKRETVEHCAASKCIASANADNDRHAFILDRPFAIALPTSGQHITQPGYGDRDYAKYYKSKQVKFPFDVYLANKSGFVPANTWITIPVNQELTEFYMPVWVPEGKYTIKYRGIAINEPTADNPYYSGQPHVDYDRKPIGQDTTIEEHEANRNLSSRTENELMTNHVAYDTIEVDVVGRLYDMHITDILDYNWQNVFRSTDGLLTHTGNTYWVGTNEIDGAPRGNVNPYVLPVRHGSHGIGYPNQLQNVAVKTGYQFRFDFKTKGTMYGNKDAIRITPSFYFVDRNGNREAVDLYYHDDNNYFVKVGSEADKTYREVVLNDVLRGVEQEQLVANADFAYRHIDQYSERYKEEHTKANGSIEKFINSYLKDLSKTPIQTGTYAFQVLNGNLRTYIGPEENEVPTCNGEISDCTMVPAEDIVAREQQWYGEYSLPANVYVVEKQEPKYDENGNEIPQPDKVAGYGQQHRINENSSIFKKDGYIIVNFNIETIANGNTTQSNLTYHTSPYENAPLNNQWKMEGFKYSFTDSYGKEFKLLDGDMIFYHADRSSYDDFDSNVTH